MIARTFLRCPPSPCATCSSTARGPRATLKRGGVRTQVTLDEEAIAVDDCAETLLAIDDALERLAAVRAPARESRRMSILRRAV